MKKHILFLSALALLAAGCTKKQAEVEIPQEDAPRQLKFDLDIKGADGTRSLPSGFGVAEELYLVFDDFFSEDPLSATASFPQVLHLIRFDEAKVYYNLVNNPETLEYAVVDYLLSKEGSGGHMAVLQPGFSLPGFRYYRGGDPTATVPTYTYQLIYYSSYPCGHYFYAQNVEYTVENSTLKASFTMAPPEHMVCFNIPGIEYADADRYSFMSGYFRPDYPGHFQTITIPSLDIATNPVLVPYLGEYGEAIPCAPTPELGGWFCGDLDESVAGKETLYTIRIVDNNGTDEDATDDIVYTFSNRATLNYRDVIQLPPLTDPKWGTTYEGIHGTHNGHDWVQMGPNGLKWATMNVGAISELDPGNYYTFDEAKEAAKSWGSGWRLPKDMEWQADFRTPSTSGNIVFNLLSNDSGDFLGVDYTYMNKRYDNNQTLLYVGRWDKVILPQSGCYYPSGDDYRNLEYGLFWTSTEISNNPSNAVAFGVSPSADEDEQLAGYSFYLSASKEYRFPIRLVFDGNASNDVNMDVSFDAFKNENQW